VGAPHRDHRELRLHPRRRVCPDVRARATLLHDSHDLIHKAVGWMLREVGKRVDRRVLRGFLNRHAHDMPRTMLRYAIQHLPAAQRQRYLARRTSSARH
jgi:hypothetical protein